MHQFTIKRSKWLRNPKKSVLLNGKGSMCCLGFYLKSCGVPKKYLLNVNTPAEITISLPPQCLWLLNGIDIQEEDTKKRKTSSWDNVSKEVLQLITVNDSWRYQGRELTKVPSKSKNA